MISDFEQYRLAVLNLYAAAGRPKYRAVALKAGVSSATVHKLLKAEQRMPSADSVDRIVAVLGGDRATFRHLWHAASAELGQLPRELAQRQPEGTQA